MPVALDSLEHAARLLVGVLWKSRIQIPTLFFKRRALARLLSTLLCAVIIAVRPFSRWGGNLAFLVLTFKELIFSVRGDIAEQVQVTILNLAGGFIAIAWITLGWFIATRGTGDGPDIAVRERATLAVFLVIIVFAAGYVKSRLPRLHLPSRICCFIATWSLTAELHTWADVISEVIAFTWITLCAAIITLGTAFLLLRLSTAHFAEELASSLVGVRDTLSSGLDCMLSDTKNTGAAQHTKCLDSLFTRSIALNDAYALAFFEVRVGRLHVRSIKPLISIVEQLRREMVWGMSSGRPMVVAPEDEAVLFTFRAMAIQLGQDLLVSVNVVERSIRVGYLHAFCPPEFNETAARNAQSALTIALEKADTDLKGLLDTLDDLVVSPNAREHVRPDILKSCLFVISLIQMSHHMINALQVAHQLLVAHSTSRARVWFPRLSSAWLGRSPIMFIEESSLPTNDSLVKLSEPESTLSEAERKQGLLEQGINIAVSVQSNRQQNTRKVFNVHFLRHPLLFISILWRKPGTLRTRLRVARLFTAVGRSPHLKYAFKNALGVALLGLPAWLPSDSAGRVWFSTIHGQWMLFSYVLVLETNTGATWRVGYLRLLGTLIGALYAYTSSIICHSNPYGVVAVVVLFELFVTYIVTATTVPSLGVVASITLPPIIFAQYIDFDPSSEILLLAVYRAASIAIGIVAAITVNHFVFPRHSRVLFLSVTSRTISLLMSIYLSLSRSLSRSFTVQTRTSNHTFHAPTNQRQVLKLEREAHALLGQLTGHIVTMQDELALAPKPVRRYRRVARLLQKIFDLMTGLRKIRDNIPRKEVVSDVFKERRDLMSAICISLFACEHAFRARASLPQFLPSLRQAYTVLEIEVEQSLHHAREDQSRKFELGMSLVYAFAELEAIKAIVDNLEELLQESRQLFGTSAWLPAHMSVDSGTVAWEMSTATSMEASAV